MEVVSQLERKKGRVVAVNGLLYDIVAYDEGKPTFDIGVSPSYVRNTDGSDGKRTNEIESLVIPDEDKPSFIIEGSFRQYLNANVNKIESVGTNNKKRTYFFLIGKNGSVQIGGISPIGPLVLSL